MKITRISNAGILIENAGAKILLDGFNITNIYHYIGTIPEEYDRLMQAPDDIDYLVFTHAHDDHFNAIMVMKYMEKHPATKAIAPETALEKLRICEIAEERLISAETLPLNTNFPVNAFKTVHIGSPYRDVPHYSYYLPGAELLFTGDAIPLASNYREFENHVYKITVLASNYAHVIGSGMKTIRNILCPEVTLVLHLPDPAYDEESLHALTADSIAHNRDLDIRILELAQSIEL